MFVSTAEYECFTDTVCYHMPQNFSVNGVNKKSPVTSSSSTMDYTLWPIEIQNVWKQCLKCPSIFHSLFTSLFLFVYSLVIASLLSYIFVPLHFSLSVYSCLPSFTNSRLHSVDLSAFICSSSLLIDENDGYDDDTHN